MLNHLQRLDALRGADSAFCRDAAFRARVMAVKAWQQARLRETYCDLAADPRYAKAVAFFLDELYGTKDSAIRDRNLLRMFPTMKRLLPTFALNTVSNALELDVLAEEFDQAMAMRAPDKGWNASHYAVAFRNVGRQDDRLRQIALMRKVGEGLDQVVAKPFIYTSLKMLRRPAKLAGLGEMQQFLEAGFTAFKEMCGADFFLSTIATRETEIMRRIFDAHPAPFDGPWRSPT